MQPNYKAHSTGKYPLPATIPLRRSQSFNSRIIGKKNNSLYQPALTSLDQLEKSTLNAKNYTGVKEIGKGSFATIYKAKKNQQLFAIKEIPLDTSKNDDNTNVLREINVLKLLNRIYPNQRFYLKFNEVFYDENKNTLYIVTDYLRGYELFDALENNILSNDINKKKKIAAKILLAIEKLHRIGIVHRDLKPENIFIDVNHNDKITLLDFGFSKDILVHGRPKSSFGSPHYAAPEIIYCDNNTYSGAKTDIWSFGCVLYALLKKRLPFDSEKINNASYYKEIFDKIIKGGAILYNPKNQTDEANLIRAILNPNPAERLNIAQIKAHPFFNDINWEALE